MEQRKRLSDGELDVMDAVWAGEGPVSSTYVHGKLKGVRDWALPAVITALNRLVDKGFLSCGKEGRINYYRPLVSREEYRAAEGRGLLDRLYGSSCKGLVASLVEGRAIGREELEELRRYLDELEGK